MLTCLWFFSINQFYWQSYKIIPFGSRHSILGYTTLHTALQFAWWRHQMETFSALQALCAGNSPITGEFPPQRPVTRSFGVFFDLRLNKCLSKQSWRLWFETPSCSLWRHCNVKEHISNLRLTTNIPYLSLTGKLRCICLIILNKIVLLQRDRAKDLIYP